MSSTRPPSGSSRSSEALERCVGDRRGPEIELVERGEAGEGVDVGESRELVEAQGPQGRPWRGLGKEGEVAEIEGRGRLDLGILAGAQAVEAHAEGAGPSELGEGVVTDAGGLDAQLAKLPAELARDLRVEEILEAAPGWEAAAQGDLGEGELSVHAAHPGGTGHPLAAAAVGLPTQSAVFDADLDGRYEMLFFRPWGALVHVELVGETMHLNLTIPDDSSYNC